MSSKWLPWDFFNTALSEILVSNDSLVGMHFYDVFLEAKANKSIPRNSAMFQELIIFNGPEVSVDWIEEKLCSLDLFGGSEAYLIINASKIPKVALESLSEKSKNSMLIKKIFLSFSGKADSFDYLAKNGHGGFYKMTAPPFWENDKLLGLIENLSGVVLGYDLKSYLLESLPGTPADLFFAVEKLKNQNLIDASIDEIKEVISPSKVDHFEMAQLLAKKDFRKFLDTLIKVKCSNDDLMGFFSFLEGHLSKLYDTRYSEKRPRLSKYDRQILDASRLWKKSEIIDWLNFCSEMLIGLKSKDIFIIEKLKQRQFQI